MQQQLPWPTHYTCAMMPAVCDDHTMFACLHTVQAGSKVQPLFHDRGAMIHLQPLTPRHGFYDANPLPYQQPAVLHRPVQSQPAALRPPTSMGSWGQVWPSAPHVAINLPSWPAPAADDYTAAVSGSSHQEYIHPASVHWLHPSDSSIAACQSSAQAQAAPTLGAPEPQTHPTQQEAASNSMDDDQPSVDPPVVLLIRQTKHDVIFEDPIVKAVSCNPEVGTQCLPAVCACW